MIKDYDMIEIYILQLLDEKDGWWTIEEISIKLQLSNATTQKYVALIKARLFAFNKDEIWLEVVTCKGIRLHRHFTFNLHILYSDILKKQLAFSLIDSTLKFGSIPTAKIALDNFTSIASVHRKYLTLNTTLKQADLSIKGNVIKGKEEQIRCFYSEYYWQIFKGTKWPFPSISKPHIYQFIERIEQILKIHIAPGVKEKISYWLAVSHIRYAKGYHVTADVEIKKYTSHNPYFFLFLKYLDEYYPKYNKISHPQKSEEMELLFFTFSSISAVDKNKTFRDKIFLAHQKGNTLIYNMTQDWLSLYKEYFYDTDFNHSHVQNKLLHIHSLAYLYTIDETLLFKTNYSKELIENYPSFFSRMKKIYDILSEHYPSISKNKYYLMENYTLLAIEHLVLNIFEPVIRIAFSFSTGHLYELVGQKKLSEYFSGKYKLEFVDHFKTKDILITDLPQLVDKPLYPVIGVNLQLHQRDLYNIEQAILKYLKNLNTK